MARRVRRGVLSLRQQGEAVLRAANPDDGFGYLGDLKRAASEAARKLGHQLGPWKTRLYTDAIADAFCTDCNRIVVANSIWTETGVPGPIYGPAVREDCAQPTAPVKEETDGTQDH